MFVPVKLNHPEFDNVILKGTYDPETEGKDHINISPRSRERVGVLLHPTFQARFNSIVGITRSLEDYVAYFVVEGYDPSEYTHRLGRSILKQAEAKDKKFVWPPNYHSILFLGMVERMFTLNKTMRDTMLNHFSTYTGRYTSYRIRKPNTGVFVTTSDDIRLRIFDQSIGYYVRMVDILNDVVYTWYNHHRDDEHPMAKLKEMLYTTALKLKGNVFVPIFEGTEHVFGTIPVDVTPEMVYEAAIKEEQEAKEKTETDTEDAVDEQKETVEES